MRAVSLVRFELPAAGEATLEVFNVQGRRVRRVASGWFEAGPHQALWSGADDAGRALPSGVYFVRLEAAGEREVRRVALRR
jgi:flagellar hook assembly protein FlgD